MSDLCDYFKELYLFFFIFLLIYLSKFGVWFSVFFFIEGVL